MGWVGFIGTFPGAGGLNWLPLAFPPVIIFLLKSCRVGGFALAGALVLTAGARAAEKMDPAFGQDVQLAPFVVNGKQLSLSIHARTASDRRYAEKFAEDVMETAYQTLGKSTGSGLVVAGREGEPHPVMVIRKFQAMATAGQLDPVVAAKAAELTAHLERFKKKLHLDEAGGEGPKLSFDLMVPALPLPLEGLASKLYQLSWAENFDDIRIERKLRSLTVADLEGDTLSKYDWVFYLPPRSAFEPVLKEMVKQAMKQQKFGFFKRAAVRSALVVFKPAVKKSIEAVCKGILFMTILRAESGYSEDDVGTLTTAYIRVLMPDFKFDGGSEHRRALEAIETQKTENAEYAKDPFISPARLTRFEPTGFVPFVGEYGGGDGKSVWLFTQKEGSCFWQRLGHPPQIVYAAGERLFVTTDGRMTLQFQIDEKGRVTGVEERRVRYRRTIPRKL